MRYIGAPGSKLQDEQAQIYGERIHLLIQENAGTIDTALIVEDAKGIDSPLHSFFEWDDPRAAHRWRREQARYLLRVIHVVVREDDDGPVTTRAFHNVCVQVQDSEDGKETPATRVYVTSERVASEEELHRQIIDEALRYLSAWRKRYEQYSELRSIFSAIDVVQGQLDLAPEIELVVG